MKSIYYSIGDNHFRIDLNNNEFSIWKEYSVQRLGYYICEYTGYINSSKNSIIWNDEAPIELKYFCEKLFKNKVFW